MTWCNVPCIRSLMLMMLFSACEPYQNDRVRFSGWLSTPGEEVLVRNLVDTFEASAGGVPVNYQPITANYDEKIQLMLGTGTAPDVFMLEAFWAPNLISFDVLMPLDSLISADSSFDLADFEPRLLDAFRRDGVLYGLPKDYSTLVLYYNPQAFEEAGLEQPPSNWEELVSYARTLTRDSDGDGVIDRYGLVFPESLDYLLPLVWQNKGDFFSSDSSFAFRDPPFLEAIQLLKDMHDEGIAVLPTEVGAAWNMDAFGRNRAAMAMSGLWAYNFLNDSFENTPYAVAPLPVHKEEASIAYIVGYVIPRQTRYPVEAWKLLRFLTSKAGQVAWAEAEVGLPPRYSVVDSLQLLNHPVKAAFIESAPYARPWQLGEDQRLFAESQTALQAIFLTDIPIEEAMKQLESRLTR